MVNWLLTPLERGNNKMCWCDTQWTGFVTLHAGSVKCSGFDSEELSEHTKLTCIERFINAAVICNMKYYLHTIEIQKHIFRCSKEYFNILFLAKS